jgi:hypothetical protein
VAAFRRVMPGGEFAWGDAAGLIHTNFKPTHLGRN